MELIKTIKINETYPDLETQRPRKRSKLTMEGKYSEEERKNKNSLFTRIFLCSSNKQKKIMNDRLFSRYI